MTLLEMIENDIASASTDVLAEIESIEITFDQRELPIEAHKFFSALTEDELKTPPVRGESKALRMFMIMQMQGHLELRKRNNIPSRKAV